MIGVLGSADGRCHTFKDTLSSVSIRKVSCSNSIISGVLEYVLVGLIPYDKTVDVSRMSIKVVLFMIMSVLPVLFNAASVQLHRRRNKHPPANFINLLYVSLFLKSCKHFL